MADFFFGDRYRTHNMPERKKQQYKKAATVNIDLSDLCGASEVSVGPTCQSNFIADKSASMISAMH